MIDPEQVKRVALSAARSLVVAWLPGGVFHGDEYDVRNPCRADDDCPGNFRINVATGQWADFAVENVRGESVVSLCGYLRGLDSREAHEEVARQLGMIGDAASAPGNISAFVARVKRGDGAVAGEPLRCVFPVPDSAPPATNLGPMHWAYRDREGRLLGYVKRYKNGKDKAFSPITWWQDEHGKMGQWQMKHWPQPKPLYGLWRLPERPEAPVLLVEGEKTCEAAQRHFGAKFECLTWPGGASAWKVAHWLPLRGREVWLLPDDDEPGTKAMAGIATILKAICAEVHLASLAEPIGKGWDVADVETLGLDWLDGQHWTTIKERPKPPPKKEAPKVRQTVIQPWEALPVPALARLEAAISERVDHHHPLASQQTALSLAAHVCARRYVGESGEPAALHLGVVGPDGGLPSTYRGAMLNFLSQCDAMQSFAPIRIQSEQQIVGLLAVHASPLVCSIALDATIRTGERQHSGYIMGGLQTLVDLYAGRDAKLETPTGRRGQVETRVCFKPTINWLAFMDESKALQAWGDFLDGHPAFQPVWLDETRIKNGNWSKNPDEPYTDDLIEAVRRIRAADPILDTIHNGINQTKVKIGGAPAVYAAAGEVQKLTGKPSCARAFAGYVRRMAVVLAVWSDPDEPVADDGIVEWCCRRELARVKAEWYRLAGKSGDGRVSDYDKVLEAIENAGVKGITISCLSRASRRFRAMDIEARDELIKRLIEDGAICYSEPKTGGKRLFAKEIDEETTGT